MLICEGGHMGKVNDFYKRGLVISDLYTIWRHQESLKEQWECYRSKMPEELNAFMNLAIPDLKIMTKELSVSIDDYIDMIDTTSFDCICELVKIIMQFEKLRVAIDLTKAQKVIINYINN